MKNYSKKLSVTFTFESNNQAKIIADSLQPEIKKENSNTYISLNHNNKEIELNIYAMQTNVLRAIINSYIRWIKTAYSVVIIH